MWPQYGDSTRAKSYRADGMSVPFVPGYVMAKLFSRRDAMATTAKQDAETLEDGMESRLALESVARDLETL